MSSVSIEQMVEGCTHSKLMTECLSLTLNFEGGYVNNPFDRGGETNWGITKTTARAWGYKGEMKDLSPELAARIYEDVYVTRNGAVQGVAAACGLFAGAVMFDFAVNSGERNAVFVLQRCLNRANRSEQDWDDLKVDGWWGDKTRTAVEAYARKRGQRMVLIAFIFERARFFADIVDGDETQEIFYNGWLARANELLSRVYLMN